uniref:Uncharacterized protein n=1 Tax=Stegastes partitus TaxID=144197 RepID=A0A3B5ASU2_9TELE
MKCTHANLFLLRTSAFMIPKTYSPHFSDTKACFFVYAKRRMQRETPVKYDDEDVMSTINFFLLSFSVSQL